MKPTKNFLTPAETPQAEMNKARDRIAADIAAFLAKGGKITYLNNKNQVISEEEFYHGKS